MQMNLLIPLHSVCKWANIILLIVLYLIVIGVQPVGVFILIEANALPKQA
jgi:hypothetical protein